MLSAFAGAAAMTHTARPRVSVITPTLNRERWMPGLFHVFDAQTYPEKELLVLDDSTTASRFFGALDDPRVVYLHSDVALTIGEKRNRLVERATGEIVVCFDDDDFYAAHYLDTVVRLLQGHDAVKLGAWFVYAERDRSLYYWDTATLSDIHFLVAPDRISPVRGSSAPADFVHKNLNGYGFSLAFWKRCFGTARYPAENHGEDLGFVLRLRDEARSIRYARDESGMVLHILHSGNTSSILPQYRLPGFMLGTFFPGLGAYFDAVGRGSA